MGIAALFIAAILLFLLCEFHESFDPTKARISVDYGPRLVGVAVSDCLNHVRPLITLTNNGKLVELSNQITDLARAQGAKEFIVGLPVDSNGKVSYKVKNFNGQLCLNFSRVLCAVVNEKYPQGRVLLVDERYTTKAAKIKMKTENIKASLDAVAAACLLERYIDDEGEGSIDAIPYEFPVPTNLAYFDYNLVKKYIREQYYED